MSEPAPNKPFATVEPFVSNDSFSPPPDAKIGGTGIRGPVETVGGDAPPLEEGPKIGRPRLTDEEKEFRRKEREARDKMGDLFETVSDEEAAEMEANERAASGGSSHVPPPNGTDPEPKPTEGEPTRKRKSSREYEALAELVLMHQYGLIGFLLDPDEANPLAVVTTPENPQGVPLHPHGQEMHLRLKMAYAEYFQIQKVSVASPGALLLLTNTGYFINVAMQPKSGEKLRRWVSQGWKIVSGWFDSLFGGKKK